MKDNGKEIQREVKGPVGSDLRNAPVKTLFLKMKSSLRAARLFLLFATTGVETVQQDSTEALLDLVWIREAKKMRMPPRSTGRSHTCRKQLVYGSRTEQTGNTLGGGCRTIASLIHCWREWTMMN